MPRIHTVTKLVLALVILTSLAPGNAGALELPSHWDWREQGKVTPVKNQGTCQGATAAFAAVAAIESKILILANNEMDLSEQQLVSCGGGVSCAGGYPDRALNYIRDNGLWSESSFPYRAAQVNCAPYKQRSLAKIEGWYTVTSDNDIEKMIVQIKEAIHKDGPVVAYMKVYKDFSDYRSGIYKRVSNDYRGMTALLLIGWDDKDDYWIAKNSWGSYWGENGFIRIDRHTDTGLYDRSPLAVLRTDHDGDGVWDGIQKPLIRRW